MGLFSTTSLALPFSSLTTDRKEDERARREGERSAGTEASVGNDDANASTVWIPVVCLMTVIKEELGRRTPMVERAANLSADPCWREKAVNSVNTMKGVLKERGSMVMICEIVVFKFYFISFLLCVCVGEREREKREKRERDREIERFYKFWFLLLFFFFGIKKSKRR